MTVHDQGDRGIKEGGREVGSGKGREIITRLGGNFGKIRKR